MEPKSRQPHPKDDGTAMSNQDDLILVDKARDGDEDALLALWLRYVRLVASIIWSMLHDENDLQDRVHEVFIRFYQSIQQRSGKPIRDVRAWVARIARNLCLDEIKKRDSRPKVKDLDEHAEKQRDPRAENDRQLIEIEEVLATMTEKEQQIVRLIVYDGCTVAEVAERTGKTVHQVRGTIRSLRKRLGWGREKAHAARLA